MRGYRLIDLFAGAGGLTRGFVESKRFTPVAAVEMDPAAAATYAANFGRDHLFAADIATWVDEGDIPSADVIVGGPPCQGFSSLGKRRLDDPRNVLWRRYVDVLRVVEPRFFVIENVPQFLASSEFDALRTATTAGGRLRDYDLTEQIVDASAFGVPQRRLRGLVIGRRRDMPVLSPLEGSDAPKRTVRDAFDVITADASEVELPDGSFDFAGQSFPGAFKTSELHLLRRPTSKSLERYRAVPPGGNRFDIPDALLTPCWRKHRSGSADVMGRLRWAQPSVTIRTEFYKPEKGRYLHPELHRPITHYEAALLQSFDDNHVWCGSKTAIGRQIGNAVPPRLATAIAQHLLNALDHDMTGSKGADPSEISRCGERSTPE